MRTRSPTLWCLAPAGKRRTTARAEKVQSVATGIVLRATRRPCQTKFTATVPGHLAKAVVEGTLVSWPVTRKANGLWPTLRGVILARRWG